MARLNIPFVGEIRDLNLSFSAHGDRIILEELQDRKNPYFLQKRPVGSVFYKWQSHAARPGIAVGCNSENGLDREPSLLKGTKHIKKKL